MTGLRPWLAGLTLAVAALATPATAHKPSDGFVSLDVADGAVTGRVDLALRDLDQAIGLDADGDGIIIWAELLAQEPIIAGYLRRGLSLRDAQSACPLQLEPLMVVERSSGVHAAVGFSANCPAAGPLILDYRLLFETDPLHRGLLHVTDGAHAHSAIFSPERPAFTIQPGAAPDRWTQAATYLREGVWHIWIGLDHILFLVTLLLPAVLRREGGRWVAAGSLREASIEVLKTVTAFTVAHSITLSLAVLELVVVPSRLTESIIAASIIVAACNNVWPLVTRRLWLLAFLFGLFHGLGFAGALQELGLPTGTLALSLVAFNLGVELGQLAIVALFLPVAFAARLLPIYRTIALRVGSMAIAAVGALWLIERAFDVVLLV
jgi:hypothetical protein